MWYKQACRHQRSDQRGFIPMIIALVLVVVGVMFIAFQQVLQAQN